MFVLSGLFGTGRVVLSGLKLSKYPLMMSVQICSDCSTLNEDVQNPHRQNETLKNKTSSIDNSKEEPDSTQALSDQHLLIHKLHQEACKAGRRTYNDPESGYEVFTEFAHKERGRCCGSACRHCPYGQMNVKDCAKKKNL